MKVIVKARHMDLTPAMKEHAEEKLGDGLMRIFDQPATKIEIELTNLGDRKDGNNMECRATVTIPHGNTVNITEISDNLYKAIDLCHDRLLVQVKRERGKRRDASRDQKEAVRMREQTARDGMTVAPEKWENEVEEYNRSRA